MTSLAPVTVITWFDPPLRSDLEVGQSTTLWMQCLDPVLKTGVTPDIVQVSYEQPNVTTTPTTVTPTASSTTTGLFSQVIVLNKPGKWLISAVAQGNPGAVGIGISTQEIYVFPTGL